MTNTKATKSRMSSVSRNHPKIYAPPSKKKVSPGMSSAGNSLGSNSQKSKRIQIPAKTSSTLKKTSISPAVKKISLCLEKSQRLTEKSSANNSQFKTGKSPKNMRKTIVNTVYSSKSPKFNNLKSTSNSPTSNRHISPSLKKSYIQTTTQSSSKVSKKIRQSYAPPIFIADIDLDSPSQDYIWYAACDEDIFPMPDSILSKKPQVPAVLQRIQMFFDLEISDKPMIRQNDSQKTFVLTKLFKLTKQELIDLAIAKNRKIK